MTARWEAHLRGETPTYAADWRLLCGDGTYRWVRSQARVSARDERGRTTRIAGIYVDIHEQKTAELAFAESEAILESLLASWPDGVVVLDPDLAVVRCNPAAAVLFQRSGRELHPGDAFLPLVAEPNRERMRAFLAEVTENGSGTIEGEDHTLGTGNWTEITAWRTGTNAAPGLIAVTARDITERRRMEALNARAERLESLGLMAGGIAHDFNNLLMTFAANIDLALMETEAGGPVHACLVDARQASLRAGDLVRQLLAYSGKGATHTRPVDCSALVDETVRLLRKTLPAGVTLSATVDRGLPFVDADRTQIQQLVLNLIVNARDAVAANGGGTIEVRTALLPAAA